MAAVYVDSPNNPLLKEFKRLQKSSRYRYTTQQIALEGPNLVREALKAGLTPRVVFYTGDYFERGGKEWLSSLDPSVKQLKLTLPLFNKISDTETPQAVAAILPFDPGKSIKIPETSFELVLLLDRIRDPGNMGTIIRTAAAAGVEALYYTTGSADPYSPKVLRATAGTIFSLPIGMSRDPINLLSKLTENNIQVIAACSDADQNYWSVDYSKPVALIVGNEASGISDRLLAETDIQVSIPLARNTESLNASVASAVILFEIIRQRRT